MPKIAQVPFSPKLSEKTKFMSLDSWLERQLKERKERLAQRPQWSKEKLEGYEQGLIDMALDTKNQIKELNNES